MPNVLAISKERARPRLGAEYLLVLLAASILYLVSMAPGALWQDHGMAQIRVLRHDYTGDLGLALAHPLFFLFAQLFQYLPFHESAFKTNLVAPVFGALTVANFYLVLRLLLEKYPQGRSAAVVGTLSLALAHTFWQFSALAKIYTVSTFFLSLELIALIYFVRSGNLRTWLLLVFLNGVECSNHVLGLITLAVIVVWSIVVFRSRRVSPLWFAPAILVWMVGALPFEVLGSQAWRAGQPLPRVIHSMLFGEFQTQVLNAHPSVALLGMGLIYLVLDFPTPNFLLIPAGMWRAGRLVERPIVYFLLPATILHLAFAFRYNVRDQYTFFIISILFLAIWIGLGAAWWLERSSGRRGGLLLFFALLPPLVYAAIPPALYRFAPKFAERFAYPPIPYRSAPEFFFHPWKTGYHGADRLAREVFAQAGPGALILADSTAIRPFIYYQIAKGKRPDIEVAGSPYGRCPIAEKVKQLIQDLARRQILIIRPYPGYCPEWILQNFKIEPFGPIYRVIGPK